VFGVDAFDAVVEVVYLLVDQLPDLLDFGFDLEQAGVVVYVHLHLLVFAGADCA
jgi:hypothetical protein